MRKAMMAMLALGLAVPAAHAQQPEDKQAEQRRELEQKMQQLERQMRELEQELARVQPEPGARVLTMPPTTTFRFFGNHAYLGVNVSTDNSPATDSIGAVLAGVTPGGPAGQAGLKAGDVLTTFNGERLAGPYPAASKEESEPGRKLVDFAGKLADGDTVNVVYRRGKETHRATMVARDLSAGSWRLAFTPPAVHVETGDIATAARRAAEAQAGAYALMPELMADRMYDRWFGMELVALNPELGDYFGTSEGLLVIRAADDSTLRLKGGDVILAVDGRKPTSQAQLVRILGSYAPGEEVHLDIMRQKRRVTVTAKVPDQRRAHDGFQWERGHGGVMR